MKLIYTAALSLALSLGSNTQSWAKTGTAKPASNPPAEAKAKPASPSEKPFPMYTRVDGIDASGKTFTHKNQDGKVVKLVTTEKTEIKNGDKPAKFEDIKVGDTISGLRLKRGSDKSEYEIVKITKFGVVEKKAKTASNVDKPKQG